MWTLLNASTQQQPISDSACSFSLGIPPKTDIFASPQLGYHFSAPIAYVRRPTESLQYARATISVPLVPARNENKTLQFDQAGLIFVQLHHSHTSPSAAEPGSASDHDSLHKHPRWIKAGIEFYEGQMYGSIVVRDKWCDWSLFQIPDLPASAEDHKLPPFASVTIEAKRTGDALMLLLVMPNGVRSPIRKVPWWFMEDEMQEMSWVGVYGARPDPFDETREEMEVRFADVRIG